MTTKTKVCAADGCGEAFIPNSPNQKYHDKKCSKRMNMRRYRRSKAKDEGREFRFSEKGTDDQGFEYRSKAESKDGRATARRGPGYNYFITTPWPERLSRKEVKQADALAVMATEWPDGLPDPSQANVSRWMAAWHEDQALGAARDNHEPDLSHTDDLGSFTRRYFPDLLVPDFHLEWEADIDSVVGTGGRLLILGPQRFGKAIDADEEMWTLERGWVSASDVREGEHLVASDGSWTKVTGVFPQGVTEAVEVTFSDGSSLVTNPEHKWTVRQRYSETTWRERTSAELADDLWETTSAGHRNAKWRIPIVRPALGDPTSALPIDPYVLGVWLGDGSSTKSEITSEDAEVIEAVVARHGEPTYEYKAGNAATYGFTGGFKDALRRLNLINNKHVPDIYLRASLRVREAVLQGLMDTDGTVNVSSNSVSYCTTSPDLHASFCALVASLGGVHRTYEKDPWFYDEDGEKVHGKRAYDIYVRLPEGVTPFRLTRKLELLPEVTTTRKPKRLVHDVTPVEPRETVCFAVEADDHLFCAGRDMVVTHNTELLTRYCMKRIAQDPNISIGWVSKTAALAERMVGYVRQNLEHNEKFVDDVIGPGQSFQPPTRSGYSWTNSEFTISTRTRIRKSPTMEAMGVGGTIMGKDFDLIILDDPQDRTRCLSPSQREKDVEWMFTDFLSRKEEHTGVAFIMSRQHVDDLPGNIIKDHGDKWKVKVYRAHDPVCTVPEEQVEDHVDCLLWPEKRSWAWLLPQKQQNEAHFQRNYMNNPQTDATTLITAKDLTRCQDNSRRVGEVRSDWRLIAGIDPAPAKPNAAVLFGWDGEKRHVVDVMEAEAGIRGGRTILRAWRETYGCQLFVLEKNIAEMWWQDKEISEMLQSGWVNLEPHYTSRINKHDPAHGVVAMFSHMRKEDPTITFPSADRESRQKMDRVFRTLLMFDPDYVNHKHVDDDIPMAMWFPQSFMDRWSTQWVERAIVAYDQTPYQFKTAYPARSNQVTRRARSAA